MAEVYQQLFTMTIVVIGHSSKHHYQALKILLYPIVVVKLREQALLSLNGAQGLGSSISLQQFTEGF